MSLAEGGKVNPFIIYIVDERETEKKGTVHGKGVCVCVARKVKRCKCNKLYKYVRHRLIYFALHCSR